MKPTHKILTSLGVFALGTCIAIAQDGAPKGEGAPKGDGGNRIAEFLKRSDTNADGKISLEEFNEFSKRDSGDRFSKIDANGDGFVDQAEVGQIGERMREGGMRRPGGEGGSSAEGGFRRPPGGDKPEGDRPAPSPEGEKRPMPPEGQRPEGQRPEGQRPEGQRPGGPGGQGMVNIDEIYGRMDKNADGSVDKEEYIEFSKQEVETRFTRLDENQDAKVSKEEMKSGMDRLRGMMRGPGGPGGGSPGGPNGFRRPGGEGGEGMRRPGGEGGAPGSEGGFRRPPQEGGSKGSPRPEAEAEAPKKDPA